VKYYNLVSGYNWEKLEPKLWLDKNQNLPDNPKSIAIDGSIWILAGDNSISRYYAGALQEKFELNIFPEEKNFIKLYLKPPLPYIYLLESEGKRIILLNKQREIIKQYQSDKFDNLKDLAVSADGKIIYVLNGSTLYALREVIP